MKVRIGWRVAIAVATCALLAACAGNPPSPVHSDPSGANVRGQMTRDPDSLAKWKSFALISIDNKPVQHGFMADRRDTLVRVAPGEHLFVVAAEFNNGFGTGGPWQAVVEFQATVLPGGDYVISGEVRGARMASWLEDVTSHQRVAGEGEGRYGAAPRAPGVIPIYIPAKK